MSAIKSTYPLIVLLQFAILFCLDVKLSQQIFGYQAVSAVSAFHYQNIESRKNMFFTSVCVCFQNITYFL